MRFYIFLLITIIAGTSCSSMRSASLSTPKAQKEEPARFLENITITPGNTGNTKEKLPAAPVGKTPDITFHPAFNIESGEGIQFKYAIRMGIEVEKLLNASLYNFIDTWWGTPYKLGGATKKGIDCSAFTQLLLSSIYGIKIPRTAYAQKTIVVPVEPEELKEGDLIFFNTRGRGISHVGIYLQNNKFVHAASSSGVMISSLTENYWSKKYAGAGRAVEEEIAGTIDRKENTGF